MTARQPRLSLAFVSDRARTLLRVGSRETDAQVETLQAQGRRFLPLKPYPERALPDHVVEAAVAAVRDAHSPPSRGLPLLRQAIAGRLRVELGAPVDPDREVLVTNGGMQALFTAFAALLGPGDQLLVPAPCYFLQGIADLLGFEIVYVQMQEAEGYRWDHGRLAAAVTPRTRALFVNTPVNPTGYVLTAEDLQFLSRLAVEHGLWLVSDESYDRMVYDRRSHLSPFALAEARPNTVLIRSLTKSYAMPAWRVGYIVTNAPAIEAMTRILEWQCLYGNAVSQAAAAAAIGGPQDWLGGIAAEFQANRDSLLASLRSAPGLTCVKPQGGPFLFLNVSALGVNGDHFAHRLMHEWGIAATPGAAFQSIDHVRFAIGGSPSLLVEAGRRLQQAASAIAQAPQEAGRGLVPAE